MRWEWNEQLFIIELQAMVVSNWWSQWDVERTLKQACSVALQNIVYYIFYGIVRHIQLHQHPFLIYLWAYEIQNVLMYNVRPPISIIISRGIFFFNVYWFRMGGGCSFCWYWCNCWPSLFKLSFHRIENSSMSIKLWEHIR